MLPTFGSELVDLIDSPITDSTKLKINKAIFDAVAQWEPRLTINQITSTSKDTNGILTITLNGTFNGEQVSITGLQPLTPTTPVATPDPPTPTDEDFQTFLSVNDNFFLSGNDNIFGWTD